MEVLSFSGLRAFARLSLVGIFLAMAVINSVAQSDRTLECGARIVSRQPFGGGRLCLFVSDTRDRTRVSLRPCTQETSDPGFLWKIVRRDGGGLHIISAMSGQERRMEVADYSKVNGGTIQMWGPNASDGYRNQTWDFFPVDPENTGVLSFLIINVDSGKCLNVPLGRNRLDQEFLQQFTCERRPNDIWIVEPVQRGCR